MLSSIISVKAILAVVALISVGSAAGVTAAPSIIHDLTATNANLTQAEQAAITYVNDHYPGNGTSKILKVENDTENGTAVFDIKVLAPNGTVYVVQGAVNYFLQHIIFTLSGFAIGAAVLLSFFRTNQAQYPREKLPIS